jgi:hypothetical protein
MSEGWKSILSDLGQKALQATVIIVVEEVIRRSVQAYPNFKYQDQNQDQRKSTSE